MVDLLSRVGYLDKAKDIINIIPFESNALVWHTLLGAYRIYYNLELGNVQ